MLVCGNRLCVLPLLLPSIPGLPEKSRPRHEEIFVVRQEGRFYKQAKP
jgi:hypothetical protein